MRLCLVLAAFILVPDGAWPDGRQGTASAAVASPNVGGETCETATPMTSLPFGDLDTTAGHVNDLGAIPAGCASFTAVPGPDLVYRFLPGPGNSMVFLVTPDGPYDPAIAIFQGCGGGQVCLAGSDSGGPGQAEAIGPMSFAPGQTYFLWVDSSFATGPFSAGPFTLSVTGVLPAELIRFGVE